jgi:formylglycine-generating enzyme required for sulfatase activity
MLRLVVVMYGVLIVGTFAPWVRAEVLIDAVSVGNPGNASDPADGDSVTPGIQHFGAVPYVYSIGKYDVTVSQYVDFLNAKDADGSNPLGLYSTNMSDATFGGIDFIVGNASGSKYEAVSGRENRPVNYVSWYDAIRFANWLNNGQGIGDTETGAYTLGELGLGGVPVSPPLTHNAGAVFWLPTENEWYKAAYYNPNDGSYYLYPTSSNLIPHATDPTAIPNHANFNSIVGNLTDVGAYSGTTSPYGAFDMGGNAYQWNESLINGTSRGLRAGSFNSFTALALQSQIRLITFAATAERYDVSFRIATVPEPSTLALAAIGVLVLAARRRFA